MTIRRATPDDLSALTDLFASFAEEQAALDARLVYADDAVARQRTLWRDALRSRTYAVFVAEADSEIVGYQSAEHWYEPPLYEGGREIYLHELFVRPAHRGRGLGTALARAAIAWAEEEGATRLRFSVLAGNAASRRLWERIGAQVLAATYTFEIRATPSDQPAARPLGFVR